MKNRTGRSISSSEFAFLCVVSLVCLPASLSAATYDGVDFPNGDSSFADRVIDFSLNGATGVEPPHDDAQRALGPPDDTTVSLGSGPNENDTSSLVLAFDDTPLVNVQGTDLVVFETGLASEAMQVAISAGGNDWTSLGKIDGSTTSIDLANSGIAAGAEFQFVALFAHPDGDNGPAPDAGPDVDAVGVIGSTGSTGNNNNNDPAVGLTCAEVVGCIANCADNDDACMNQCYSSGTSRAQSRFEAFAQCSTNQCSNGTASCLCQSCQSQLQNCGIYDAACNSGSNNNNNNTSDPTGNKNLGGIGGSGSSSDDDDDESSKGCGGCNSSGGMPAGQLALLAVALLAVVRRRR